MANSTCLTGTSISDLLDKADQNLLNLTATIASCPDICTLAWGQGNPDLLGIGVFISYIMQAVLTLLCGPILGLICYVRRRKHDERCEHGERCEHVERHEHEVSDRLSEIVNSFIDTSIGFNIPIGIAATVRIAQSAPLFDQYFSSYLLGMQSFSFLVVVLTSAIFEQRKDHSTAFFCLGIQIFLLTVASGLQSWISSRWLSTRQLLESCRRYSQIFLPSIVSENQVICHASLERVTEILLSVDVCAK